MRTFGLRAGDGEPRTAARSETLRQSPGRSGCRPGHHRQCQRQHDRHRPPQPSQGHPPRLAKTWFRPEFLNRIDDIIIFTGLDNAQLRQITELLLDQTRRWLQAQEITLEATPEAVDWLAERGHQPQFGVRPLRRALQRELDSPLSKLVLGDELHSGDTVTAKVVDGRLGFDVTA